MTTTEEARRVASAADSPTGRFTPEPWTVHDRRKARGCLEIRHDGLAWIADVYRLSDATLMAAALDLRSLAEDVIELLDVEYLRDEHGRLAEPANGVFVELSDEGTISVVRRAKAAIAKAKGEDL